MVSHQCCPAFGDRKPATVSPAIYRYIRKKLVFQGVITTDAMGMKGVLALHECLGHACAEAAASGVDLVLAKCHPAIEDEVFQWIKRYVNEGKITEADLDAKIGRILKMKADQGLFKDYFEPKKALKTVLEAKVSGPIRTAAKKCAILVRDEAEVLPLKKEQKILVIEPFYREWQGKGFDNFYQPGMLSLSMEKYARVVYFETDVKVSDEEAANALKHSGSFDVTVVNSFYWRGCPTNAGLVQKLIDLGRKVVVVAAIPYENVCLPAVKTLIVNWGQVPECQRAAADILFGKAKSKGKWPLKGYKIRGIK
jgi:beta-N-acetylhexosaminidase